MSDTDTERENIVNLIPQTSNSPNLKNSDNNVDVKVQKSTTNSTTNSTTHSATNPLPTKNPTDNEGDNKGEIHFDAAFSNANVVSDPSELSHSNFRSKNELTLSQSLYRVVLRICCI